MNYQDLLWGAIGPLIGWGWTVEKRLTKLEAIKETVDKTGERVEKIVDHLIEKAGQTPQKVV